MIDTLGHIFPYDHALLVAKDVRDIARGINEQEFKRLNTLPTDADLEMTLADYVDAPIVELPLGSLGVKFIKVEFLSFFNSLAGYRHQVSTRLAPDISEHDYISVLFSVYDEKGNPTLVLDDTTERDENDEANINDYAVLTGREMAHPLVVRRREFASFPGIRPDAIPDRARIITDQECIALFAQAASQRELVA